MRRISTATRVIDKFGTGKDGFTNGNAVSGIAATDLEDVWFDHVQEEIANVVEGSGLTLDASNRAQLLAAIQRMFAPAIGGARNVAMNIAAASASATLTADEVTVGTALGGRKFLLASFSKTINLATTGAGGMDTGTAPASGFVALYAIYNPSTNTSALLAVNASSAVAAEVYAGANMPAGYTASALVSVVPTNASSQLQVCTQQDRVVTIPNSSIFSTSAAAATPTIANNLAVPLNAKFCSGWMQAGSSAAGAIGMGLYATNATAGVGAKTMAVTITAGSSLAVPFDRLRITTGQRVFYTASSAGGTSTFAATINQYEF